MKELLIVVDMQNDFVGGVLGSEDARNILEKVNQRIEKAEQVVYTLDTHGEDYLSTQEGTHLPVPHCIRGTAGHRPAEGLRIRPEAPMIEKPTFGSTKLGDYVKQRFEKKEISSVVLVGVCTDICVISNALLLKAFCPELPVFVDSACCAGVSKERHETALAAMEACQITVL